MTKVVVASRLVMKNSQGSAYMMLPIGDEKDWISDPAGGSGGMCWITVTADIGEAVSQNEA